MTRLLFGFAICLFVTASFVDTHPHRSEDYKNAFEEQDENVVQQLMHLLHSYKNKENRRNIEDDLENWTGRWMPDKPDDSTPSSKTLPKNNRLYEYESITEYPHEMYMGHVSPECDDAKTNLTVDWDHSSAEYTCYGSTIIPSIITPKIYCETIPKTYKAAHKCMNQKIEYDDDIPVYGPHRPLWPVYGEYEYLPKQRWLHSLEHGAIVMLYHPCANPLEVERLKNLVNKCLWRHVITPYSYLDEERPLALLSWGCRLTMSYVNPKLVNRFIRKKALSGPEWQIADDGQFEDGLLARSSIVTDPMDSVLCPNI